MEFDGVATARPILEALGTLRHWNAERVRKPPPGTHLEFVPEKWRPYVSPSPGEIDRHYFELCAMSELHRALKSAEIWARGGRHYGNVEDLGLPASLLAPRPVTAG